MFRECGGEGRWGGNWPGHGTLRPQRHSRTRCVSLAPILHAQRRAPALRCAKRLCLHAYAAASASTLMHWIGGLRRAPSSASDHTTSRSFRAAAAHGSRVSKSRSLEYDLRSLIGFPDHWMRRSATSREPMMPTLVFVTTYSGIVCACRVCCVVLFVLCCAACVLRASA